MKKLLIIAIISTFAISCYPTQSQSFSASPVSKSKLWNTATYCDIAVNDPVVTPPLIADLEVSPNKISFPLFPSSALLKTDLQNIINAAVKEALKVNGNSDVLIGLEYQIKYDDDGVIESVTVTGYPAKYVNFRHPDESIWLNDNTFIRDVQ